MSNIEEVIKSLDEGIPVIEKMVEFKMNYKPQSLKKLEDYITNAKRIGRGIPFPVQALLAVYLGETIVRNIKEAKWVDNDNLSEVYIRVPFGTGHTKAYPYIRIQKFSKSPNDGLYAFYCMLQDANKGRMDFQESDSGNITVSSPRGYQLTGLKIPNELYEQFRNGQISEDEMLEAARKNQEE